MKLPFTIKNSNVPFNQEHLPNLLETALTLLLDGFDYEANKKSNQAIAIRILAVTLHHLRKNN